MTKSKNEMTDLMYALFEAYVSINLLCFRGCSISDVVDRLCDAVCISDLQIDMLALKTMIAWYCDEHDTGIYY